MNNEIEIKMEIPSGLIDRASNVGLNLEQHFIWTLENSLGKLEGKESYKRIFSNPGGKIDKVKHEEKSQRNAEEFLNEFEEYCRIDRNLADSTTKERMRYAKKLVKYLDKEHPIEATKQDLREFVKQFSDHNARKTLRVIYGGFLGTDIADSFKLPQPTIQPKKIPSKEELQKAYDELEELEYQTAFLMLASSGLRRGELLSLTIKNIDFEIRMLSPKRRSQTKNAWMSFYNDEAEEKLQELLKQKGGEKIFTSHPDTYTKKIREASDGEIRPKDLRDWFNEEMIDAGVPELYVDFLSGRTPRSVLRSSYTDYTPKKMKKRYEEADLSILE